jgi:hypothetical protein
MADQLSHRQVTTALEQLAKGWPDDLMLYSAAGSLLLVTTGTITPDLEIPESAIVAEFGTQIRNDGGDPDIIMDTGSHDRPHESTNPPTTPWTHKMSDTYSDVTDTAMQEAAMAAQSAYTVLKLIDWDALLRSIEHGHAIGPITDPTFYRDAVHAGIPQSNETLARAARDFIAVLDELAGLAHE